MRKSSSLPGLIFVVIFGAGLIFAYSTFSFLGYGQSVLIAVGSFIIASIVSYSVKVADQWERVVVLRLGRFRSLEGPGLFFIIPIIETIAYWIDTRVITSAFKAEKTLTKDTVPVDVDAVLFWKVIDPKTGGARRCRLRQRHQLGRANRASRCHRQDHAFGHAGRPG